MPNWKKHGSIWPRNCQHFSSCLCVCAFIVLKDHFGFKFISILGSTFTNDIIRTTK